MQTLKSQDEWSFYPQKYVKCDLVGKGSEQLQTNIKTETKIMPTWVVLAK